MNWFKFWPKKAVSFLAPPSNVLVKGVIERFATVAPLHIGGCAENSYALILKGETEIILFRRTILSQASAAAIALLQPGDYIEFELDHQGFGQISTLRTSAWIANWKQCTGRTANITPSITPPEPEQQRPHLILHTNPNWMCGVKEVG